jgi:hypothetical protein
VPPRPVTGIALPFGTERSEILISTCNSVKDLGDLVIRKERRKQKEKFKKESQKQRENYISFEVSIVVIVLISSSPCYDFCQ